MFVLQETFDPLNLIVLPLEFELVSDQITHFFLGVLLQLPQSILEQLIDLFFNSRCILINLLNLDVDVTERLGQQVLPFFQVRVDLSRFVYALRIRIRNSHYRMVRHLACHMVTTYFAVYAQWLATHHAEQLLLNLWVLWTLPKSLRLFADINSRVLGCQFGFMMVQVAFWTEVCVFNDAVDLGDVVLAHVAQRRFERQLTL